MKISAMKIVHFSFFILSFFLLVQSKGYGQPPKKNNNSKQTTQVQKVNGGSTKTKTSYKQPGTGNIATKLPFFPYVIELNAIDPAVFDGNASVWLQPYPMPEGKENLTFSFTLKNKINMKAGRIKVDIDGRPVVASPAIAAVTAVPANANFSGQFTTSPLTVGKHEIRLYYITRGWGLSPQTHKFVSFDSTAASAEFDYAVSIVDKDNDQMDDREEQKLLEKYSPLFLFSKDKQEEIIRPTDPIWYIQHSNVRSSRAGPIAISNSSLQNSASNLIAGDASLYNNSKKTDFRIDVAPQDALGFFNGDGHDWPEIIHNGNIGLFGHVTPIPNTPGLYKIEYWQFFGFDQATDGWPAFLGAIFGWETATIGGAAGDHAGDWTTVQLIVHGDDSPNGITGDNIVSVMHYHHGDESRFDMAGPKIFRVLNFSIKEFVHGNSFDTEHTLQLAPNNQGLYVHPVVYVEWGGHEFWPNVRGSETGAPNHNGEGKYFYFGQNIPNLGEVDFPLSENARVILGFNGYWGDFNVANNNPPGPSLHREWQWSQQSIIKGRIPVNDFEP